ASRPPGPNRSPPPPPSAQSSYARRRDRSIERLDWFPSRACFIEAVTVALFKRPFLANIAERASSIDLLGRARDLRRGREVAQLLGRGEAPARHAERRQPPRGRSGA